MSGRWWLVGLVASMLAGGAGDLRAAERAPDVVGTWTGILEAGPQKLTMIFAIRRDDEGNLKATISVPEQGLSAHPLDGATFAEGKLVLTFTMVNGKYEATLSPDGKSLEGKWIQNGVSLELNMAPGEAVKPNRPQEPKPPFPYRVEEVSYDNAAADITFHGTLTIPTTAGPHPAVFLISGSGPQDRDESIAEHKPFAVLADHLTRRGLIVLRSDDRGVNGTKGSTATSTMEDHAADALAAVAYLRTRDEVDVARIGLIGHSEGAVVAPIAAVQSDEVAFLVLLAPTGVDGRAIIADQAARILTAAGAPADLVAQSNTIRQQLFDLLLGEPDDTKAADLLRPVLETEIRRQLGKPEGDDEGVKAMVEAQIAELVNPWMRFFLAFDPVEIYREVSVPVLAMWGEKDLQVAPELNADPVETALKAGDNRAVETDILPGLNHLFQTCATGSPAEYFTIEETIAADALDRLTEWLQRVAKLP